MPVLIPISQVTARVNGGRLNVMGSLVRRTQRPRSLILIARQRKKSIPGQLAKGRMPLILAGHVNRWEASAAFPISPLLGLEADIRGGYSPTSHYRLCTYMAACEFRSRWGKAGDMRTAWSLF